MATYAECGYSNCTFPKCDCTAVWLGSPHLHRDVEDKAAERKAIPVYSGVMKYFPKALAEVAKVSKVGNDQHNPGQPLHWAREKSTDEPDALVRHLVDRASGEKFDDDGCRHLAKVAWRALAALEKELEGEEW